MTADVGHRTFDREAAGRFRLPLRFGEAISGRDDPEMVNVAAASHMRSDDYVVGLVFSGTARAYPLWIIDNYHVINDRVGGERFFVTSCERCQSGAAFRSDVPGNDDRDALFRSVAFQNATLLLKDLRSGGHWIHYEGVGLDRRVAGVHLPWIPTYHMEWADWVTLHPDSLVMAPPADPTHPDARHGHGREEFFARPGMDPAFIPTIVGELDTSYPENEMVLGLRSDDGWTAFPLAEVQREGGVVHASIGERTVAVFAGPRPDGFTMAAFIARAGGHDLFFTREDGWFRDRESRSLWTIEGTAVEGQLSASVLEPVPSFYVRWHAWIYFHRDSEVFRAAREPRPFVEGQSATGVDSLDELLVALWREGHEVRVGDPVVSQRRPREAQASHTIYVDGDRLRFHAFVSERAARDFDALGAAWSGLPMRAKSYEGRTRRLGRLVLESDPEERYVDPAQIVPIPDGAVRWAKALRSPVLDELRDDGGFEGSGGPGFADIIHSLRLARFDVVDVGFLPPAQLRVGAVDGVAMTIDTDRFLLYRFATADDARAYQATEEHAIPAGGFVLRSTPDTMYEHQGYEIRYAGDQRIRWSPLLGDGRLRRALGRAIGQE